MEGTNKCRLTIGDCKEGDIIVVDGEEWIFLGFTHDGWGSLCSLDRNQYAVITKDTPCEKV